MKKIKSIIIIMAIFTLGASSSYALNPSFIVKWNPCELSISNSAYKFEVAIYDHTTQTFVVSPTMAQEIYLPPTTEGEVSVPNWTCNEGDSKAHYTLFVRVLMIDDYGNGNTYCSGMGRSNLLTCDQLYNNQTVLNVNMVY